MIYSALLLAAMAAIASAQVTYDPASGQFTCPADNPNGAFCAGNSLSTNIIIRCNNGVGQPGNCNDNLAGFFPYGVQSSPCWQSSPTSGIAACSKNCIVQGGSGTYNGTFVLPNCTPVPNPSSTSSTAQPTTTSTYINPGLNTSTTITSTGTTTYASAGTTITKTFTTTYCPPITTPTPGPPSNSTYYPPGTLSTKTYVQPSGTGTPGSPGSPGNPSGNGTAPTASGGPGGSATATPVGPSASGTGGPILSNNAMTNSAGAGLAAVGLFIAYFL